MYVSLLEEGVRDVVVIPALSSTVLLGYVVSPGDKQNASQAAHVEDVELLFLHECKVQGSLYTIEECAHHTSLVGLDFGVFCQFVVGSCRLSLSA